MGVATICYLLSYIKLLGKNAVIVMGLDHYNSLGLARVFGINGIKPIGILMSCYDNHKYDFCYLSKYWQSTYFVDTMSEGVDYVVKTYARSEAVIFPSSDEAEEAIDCNLDRLIENGFIVPGIRKKQGEVNRLMNKMIQAEWVRSLGIKTAETYLINLLDDINVQKYPFPCIVKPVMSSDGKKLDIKKCESENELSVTLEELKEKGYSRILLQNFLVKDYEAELFGCITREPKYMPYILTKHVREWPVIGGSVSCHEFIVDSKLKNQAEQILKKIQASGFEGNIDIELFVVKDEIYLNEINFRNSGDIYACFYNKIFYPLVWYLVSTGKDASTLTYEYSDKKYAMNETTDIRHVLSKRLTLGEWLKYYRRCSDFAIKFKGDMRPAMRRYKYYIKQYIFKH